MKKYNVNVIFNILDGFTSSSYAIEAESEEEAKSKIKDYVNKGDYKSLAELETNQEIIIEDSELTEIKIEEEYDI